MREGAPSRLRLNALFVPVTLLCFIVLTFGCDLLSRVEVLGLPADDAWTAIMREPAVNPLGMFLLALPMIGSHLLAIEVGRTANLAAGVLVFVVTAVVLAWIYYNGYVSYQEAIGARRWTEATLSLGLLPIKGGVALVLPLVVAVVAARKRRATETSG